jgi:nitrite reductase (NADH) small subunit
MTLTELAEIVVFNLGPLERIPLGEGREFSIGDKEIAVFRTREGRVHALDAKCPHRDGPLADGLTGGGLVVCPYHAYKFELTTGRAVGHDCPALTAYRVEVSAAGEILLTWDIAAKGFG